MSHLKCYFGGSRDPGADYDFNAACFARDAKEARRLLWKDGDLRELCDQEYLQLRVIRKPENDHRQDPDALRGYLIADVSVLRDMGWSCEYDNECSACGLYEWDGRWPVCSECHQCPECGHETDCPEAEPHQGRGGGDA